MRFVRIHLFVQITFWSMITYKIYVSFLFIFHFCLFYSTLFLHKPKGIPLYAIVIRELHLGKLIFKYIKVHIVLINKKFWCPIYVKVDNIGLFLWDITIFNNRFSLTSSSHVRILLFLFLTPPPTLSQHIKYSTNWLLCVLDIWKCVVLQNCEAYWSSL